MNAIYKTIRLALVTLAGALALTACGGGDEGSETLQQTAPGDPVVPQNFDGLEDSPLQGMLSTHDLPPGNYQFEVMRAPEHGTLSVNVNTGEFNYTPNPDYFGVDSFDYRITRTVKRPVRGRVVINLSNVNDAPVLAAIGDMMNSPETHDTTYNLPVIDIDSEQLQVAVTSGDPGVATVEGSGPDRTIKISPKARGSTRVRVAVTDGQYSSEQEFEFTVGDVTKARSLAASMIDGDAVSMTNISESPVVFTLEHNGFPQFQSTTEMIDFVRNMAPVASGEPFERKLWRFVRDNVYHNLPVNAEKALNNPWTIISSKGWGICSHVAAVYVLLAREAGYEARVWGLTGHVVPEIRIDDQWQVFDPDLAVYYYTVDGRIAGIGDLQTDPSLVSLPVNRIFAESTYDFPYSQEVAGIYGTPADNYVGEQNFIPDSEMQFQPVTLPPGASLVYPGQWTPNVVGVDGVNTREVELFLQAKLTTPAEYAGEVRMPWMLWEIRGEGRVRIGAREFDIGTQELIDYIQMPDEQITSVSVVLAEGPIEFISFINALRYQLDTQNDIRIKGLDVWAVEVATSTLKVESRVGQQNLKDFAKPVP
jgi:hypothetical protein